MTLVHWRLVSVASVRDGVTICLPAAFMNQSEYTQYARHNDHWRPIICI